MPVLTEADWTSLVRWVLAASFGAAFVFGAIAQRTGFCTMGAVADIYAYGSWTRMRQWLLAIAVAVAGVGLAQAGGLIDVADSIYTAPRFTWLGYVLGGAVFGFGMVLAGGCGVRNLVRLGTGSLKSLVVLIVLGLVAYMTLRGWLAMIRVQWIETWAWTLPVRQDLPSLLAYLAGWPRESLQWGLALVIALALLVFVFSDRHFARFDNLLAGLGLGAVICAVWLISGWLGRVPEHPQTLELAFAGSHSGKMEALSFVAPVAWSLDWLMFTSDTSRVLSLGVVSVLGVSAGAASMALLTRRFRWEGFASTEDTAHHLVGAALMGFGGVTALGCTIGQGLSGVSTLALGSLLALVSILVGARLGLAYQSWRLERD